MVAAVIVSVTLPLGRDAGTLPERADRTREVIPPTRTLSAAPDTCTKRGRDCWRVIRRAQVNRLVTENQISKH